MKGNHLLNRTLTTKPRRPDYQREYHKLWYKENRTRWRSYMRTWMRDWRKQHPERSIENYRRGRRNYEQKRFGVRRPDYTNCELCGKKVHGPEVSLDHDHSTGKFRGWLCRACNTKLGWFENRQATILSYLGHQSLVSSN